MLEYHPLNPPPNFCAGLTHSPSGLLEVEKNYIGMNVYRIKSKGFIKITTSAIWPFRKIRYTMTKG